MTSRRSLLSGPDAATVTDHAFSWAASTAGDQPESVLCLTQSRDRATHLTRQWRGGYNQLRFTCATLDDYVSELYEHATGNMARTTLSRVQRYRLVEAAIEQFATSTNGVFAGLTAPQNTLTDHVQGMFSLLEYAGYDTPSAIDTAIRTAGVTASDALTPHTLYGSHRVTNGIAPGKSPLDEQAATVAGLYAEYERLRTEVHPEWRGVVADHYLTLLDTDQLVSTIPDAVDVVLIDGLTRLAPTERETIARLAKAFPIVAVLPLIHESWDGDGLDAGVRRALTVYHALDFTFEYHVPSNVDDHRLAAVRTLFHDRPVADSQPTDPDLDPGIGVLAPATEREEVRIVARRIRELLHDGVDPTDIGVVVTDRSTYRGILAEVFGTYDVPFTFGNELGIEQTLVGGAVESLLDLSRPAAPDRPLADLSANPLVSLDAIGIDPTTVARAIDDRSGDTLSAVIDGLVAMNRDDTASAVRNLTTRIAAADRSVTELAAAIQTVLEDLMVPSRVEAYTRQNTGSGSQRPAFERAAWAGVQRVLESFGPVAPYLSDARPRERLRRGLRAELVRGPGQQPGYVRVSPIAEAELATFKHCFVVGLTLGYFPSGSDTMAFFEAVNDADEEFTREHTGRRARYILGTLLTGSDTVTLSIPQHTIDGADHVPAPVVSELIATLDTWESDTSVSWDRDLPAVTGEDVQHDYRAWAVRESFESPTRATAPLETATGISERARTVSTQGVTCSWRRSRPRLTPHEGQLGDAVAQVLPATDREAYSPSGLEEYARCPFVFLMNSVLGFEEEYESDAAISRGDRGTYIHRVLAEFYRRLRDDDDQATDIAASDRTALEATLLAVALDRLDTLGDIESPFARRTIGRLLAGLGEPDANPYHGFGGMGATGLFARFLDTELDRQPGVATQPRYFEAGIGLDREGIRVLSADPIPLATPNGRVPIRGIADRIDVGASAPREFHVRDYKTGSTPGLIDVLAGLHLQLPLYGAVLEQALEDHTGDVHSMIAGSYYSLQAPDSIDPVASLVASKAVEGPESGPRVPLPAQSWRLPFETQREFQTFVRTVTPARVGRIVTAVENGSFQPTLLSADLAGCADCTYRHSCDVRHHQQRDTIETLDPDVHYVSERATGEEFTLDTYATGGEE